MADDLEERVRRLEEDNEELRKENAHARAAANILSPTAGEKKLASPRTKSRRNIVT